MSRAAREPRRIWWSADEIAAADLPDMPGSKRRVNSTAERMGWRGDPHRARERAGPGGGWEYHWTLFPLAAQRKLLAETAPAVETIRAGRAEAWAQFEDVSDAHKAEARRRLAILAEVEALERGGLNRDLAVSSVARDHGKSARTLWNWRALVEGVEVEDRLAYLVPAYHAGAARGPKTACDPEVWSMLIGAYLRPAKPTFAQCYRAAAAFAKARGLEIPQQRTAWRRLDAEIPRVYRVWKREGAQGLERSFAPQIRDRNGMHALEMLVADCHKIDTFVEWPDGTINRPQIVAFQDVYSAKILSWRVDHDPNKVAVMAAFGDVVEQYGIPKRCYFDNGREFANKWMTGGSPTRFRFKVRDDEPLGILPLLGVEVTWARPGHGQSKPIERSFRDLASDVAKDPRFDGAYVGHKPDAKPADYGDRAIPSAEFLQVLAEGIAEHNARPNRRGQTAIGKSFDAVFAESFRCAPIRVATDEQRRLWLMGQEVRKLDRTNGRLKLQQNYYAADWLSEHAGLEVVARFDPEDLHKGVWVYAKDGAFMGFAPCQQAVGFTDMVEAKASARRMGQIRRAQKRLDDLHNPMSAAEVGQRMSETAAARPAPDALDAKVVSPTFNARAARLAPPERVGPVSDPAVEARRDAMVVEMRPKPAPDPAKADEGPRDRYLRAKAIGARIEAGEAVGGAEHDWFRSYSQSAEYRAEARMERDFGQDASG